MQPDSPHAYLLLATLHDQMKNVDAARVSLQRALAIDPNLLAAQRALIELEVKSNHPDAALAIAKLLRKQRPAEPIGALLEGDIEASRKNFPAAIEIYRGGLRMGASSDLAIRLHSVLHFSSRSSEAEKFAAS